MLGPNWRQRTPSSIVIHLVMNSPSHRSLILAGFAAVSFLSSCAPYPGPNRRAGAAVGSATGAVAGAIIGANNGRPLVGAAIGSVAGAIAGAAIGSAQDQALADAGYTAPPPPAPRRYYYGRPYPYRRWYY